MKQFQWITVLYPGSQAPFWGEEVTSPAIQANLIITLSLGSIETDRVISEPCYNEVTFYRHIVK